MENRFSRAKRLICLSAKTFSAGSRKNELQFSEKKKRLLTRLGDERRRSKSGHLCVKKTQKMTDGTVIWALIVPVSLVL